MFGARQSTGLDQLLDRPRPTALQKFLRAPCAYVARQLYEYHTNRYFASRAAPAPPANAVRVVCISDTHNYQPQLPDGDILIHAGDLTQSGSSKELQASIDWIRSQPHSHKIVVAGNHDLLLDAQQDGRRGRPAQEMEAARNSLDWGDIIYLENTSATITCTNGRRLLVFGSPQSSRHGNWAFQYPPYEDVWSGIVPDGTDVLITHGPPRGHLDLQRLGCPNLLREVWRVRPRLHVFGHVHEGYGQQWLRFDNVQSAYEKTMIAGGGLANMMRVVKAYILAAIFYPVSEATSLLVNPSVVGGLRDQEKREPIVVLV